MVLEPISVIQCNTRLCFSGTTSYHKDEKVMKGPGNSTNRSGGNGTGISVALGLLGVISVFYYMQARPSPQATDPVSKAISLKEQYKTSTG